MGLDYALVHVTYNIPVAGLMTLLFWPFMTRLDWQKISTLIIISLVATIPWDSYLLRHHIWTYSSDALIGWTLFSIPLEEIFFFAIQTYNTSLLYTNLTRPLVLPANLRITSRKQTIAGTFIILSAILAGLIAIYCGGCCTYTGLIVTWAGPFLLIQWLFSSAFILAVPTTELIASIVLPTVFLWVVDTLSIKRGIWSIETPTKFGIQLWGCMDIEEAIFFLVTNILIVVGLVSIDYANAITTCQLVQSSEPIQNFPSYFQMLLHFMMGKYVPDKRFVDSLTESVEHLAAYSQSMYMGSALFQGPLRIDLILLYSFCRVADNLVDDARDTKSARIVIEECDHLLEAKFSHPNSFPPLPDPKRANYAAPPELIAAIDRLPVSRLRLEHLKGLLEGFRTDLAFGNNPDSFPIATESDLDTYSSHVASTVAASMLGLIVHYFPNHPFAVNVLLRRRVVDAAERMGQALQYINVARDIVLDVAINRVYLPTTWLNEQGLCPTDLLVFPTDPRLESVRERLLERADFLSASARSEIAFLPREVQGPLLALVDSYLEIGAALRRGMRPRKAGEKLKLPIGRRLWVAYRAMALRR